MGKDDQKRKKESPEEPEEIIELSDSDIAGDEKVVEMAPVEEQPAKVAKPPEEIKKPVVPPKKPTPRPKPSARLLSKSERGARRMAYFILFETILLIIVIAGTALLLYHLYTVKNRLKENVIQLNKTAQENTVLKADLEKAQSSQEELSNALAQLQGNYDILNKDRDRIETERATYKSTAEDLENKLDSLQAEIEEKDTELNQVKEGISSLGDSVKQLEDEKKDLDNKLVAIEAEYNNQQKEIAQAKEAEELKQKEFEEQYSIYAPEAEKIINELKKIHLSLTTGLDYKQFVKLIEDNLDIAFEEFKIKLQENHYKFLSFKCLNEAYNAYKETVGQWHSLARSSLPKKVGNFGDIVLKFEQPIEQYRPWVDTIQILWQKAARLTKGASAIIETHESFDPKACPVCKDKHTIICPKCAGSGECFYCHGKGFLDEKGKQVCPFCAGSGKCSFCLGKKEIPCPVCILAIERTSEK